LTTTSQRPEEADVDLAEDVDHIADESANT
jgi:hypothetical protein